ncbi:MAG: hypothetical protein J6S49_08000 [Erysipelotrichaceae bacterium]|nr:hypothetical protein [Erysipelotrichaceae bacterium]
MAKLEDLRMEMQDGIRKMISESGLSLTEIAEIMGFASVSGITNKFSRSDLKVGFVCELAGICGYEVVLRNVVEEEGRDIVLLRNEGR